jgi:hypothetical protein
MITALILTDGRIAPLAATLAALVPGVAEGLVADAVVIATKGDREIAAIAEGVGAAHLVAAKGDDPWSAAAAVARRDWLLCLEAGDVPAEGWIGAVERFVAFASEPRLGRLSGRSLRAILTGLAEALIGAGGPRAGHVLHRSLLGKRGARRRRPVRIAARIERPAVF